MIISDGEPHYAAIGRLASSWAALEAIVTSAIWQIGEMDDAIGACVTSQISTFDGKLKALVSILEVRGQLRTVIDGVNEFHRHIRPLATFRNRLIHDPLRFDPGPQRLEITADKMPVLAYKDEPTSGVLSQVDKIVEMIDRFEVVIKPALERFPPRPLPEKSKRKDPPSKSDRPPTR